MNSARLYVIVSLSGAAVLALEILGTRVLGPFYGAGLFLWSALITVTLAALALGYALGGRWADRGPTAARLGSVLALAGVWVLAIPLLRRPLLLVTEPLGLRGAVLTASVLLFFPPLTLLGIVSPYAIRLKAARVEEVGRIAGNLFAISTLASVAAALLTGFVLIPYLGVGRLILVIGALLLVAAGLALSAGRGGRAAAAGVVLLAFAGMAAAWKPAGERPDFDRGLTAIVESPYSQVRVVDRDDSRYLVIDGGIHSFVEPGTWNPLHEYSTVVMSLDYQFARRGRALVLGLGGGSVPISLARAGWQVDTVELDPEVVRLARRYFGLTERDTRVFVMDARRFLAEPGATYDLIVGDAYGSTSIPWQLLTRECFTAMSRRLAPDGIVALNVESVGWEDPMVRSTAATLRTEFPEIQALPVNDPPNALGNVIVVASRRPLDFSAPDTVIGHPRDFLPEPYQHWVVITQNHAWNNAYRPDPAGAVVMTDDRTPVDLWAERINRAARKDLHAYFGRDDVSW